MPGKEMSMLIHFARSTAVVNLGRLAGWWIPSTISLAAIVNVMKANSSVWIPNPKPNGTPSGAQRSCGRSGFLKKREIEYDEGYLWK
jgi:hypothetical protein